jgi:hypothetical protein
MFNFFKPKTWQHPILGRLVRRSGYWQGQIRILPDLELPLYLTGSRHEPNVQAISLIGELAPRFSMIAEAVGPELLQHMDLSREHHPELWSEISTGDQAWAATAPPEYVVIHFIGRKLVVEVGLRTLWDEEHTLGARFHNWQLMELNSSVLRP